LYAPPVIELIDVRSGRRSCSSRDAPANAVRISPVGQETDRRVRVRGPGAFAGAASAKLARRLASPPFPLDDEPVLVAFLSWCVPDRISIPSVTMMLAGGGILFASFLLGLMDVRPAEGGRP